MRILLAACAIAFSTFAGAAQRTYAVMSLLGDGMLLVQHRSSAGTSLSSRARQFVALGKPVFDRGALLALEAGIHHADPSTNVVLLAGRDPGSLEAQDRTLGTAGEAQAVADALRPRLPDVGATHLVLLLKARSGEPLPFAEGNVDAGELEGLGFYVDPTLVTRHEQAGSIRGYFAPFAYFGIALVDLASGKVVAERAVHAARPYEATESNALKPWEELGGDEKLRVLQSLLDDEAEAAATALLAPRRP